MSGFHIAEDQIEKVAEEVARAVTEFNADPTIPHYSRHIARAVLVAAGPMIAAQALRDAARDARHRWGVKPDPSDWLTDRADQIEKEVGR
ncbi:hypothetical protein [Stenotrophomonas virus Jojan60]|nr:hypothetical protein [Stenotrophomonas virus Jojan60]